MLTNVLGYPRMGAHRELKRAVESFWKGEIDSATLKQITSQIKRENWLMMKSAGIDLIPSGDFSLYDHILDMTLTVGAIPARYDKLRGDKQSLYFAMAHGLQNDGNDVIAMEMTKWFDTNYHYIVPEFTQETHFELYDNKPARDYKEALDAGVKTKPVIIGPASYLLLGKAKGENVSLSKLAESLLPVYAEILDSLKQLGAEWVQIDEPCLVRDLTSEEKELYKQCYDYLRERNDLKTIIATYFDGLYDNTELTANLGEDYLHIDLVAAPAQLNEVLSKLPKNVGLSIGIVEGRNIWKNDFDQSIKIINGIVDKIGKERVLISTSCSLLHSPIDLDNEKDEQNLPATVKQWMAFARQKVDELRTIANIADGAATDADIAALDSNRRAMAERRTSPLIHREDVKRRVASITEADKSRKSPYAVRSAEQHAKLKLPLLPTTTIGSFPQTAEVRQWRSRFRKGNVTREEYNEFLRSETVKAIKTQEELGLDVLVHGEFERNDMVEYFGEQLDGFAFTQNGWVQSYGSRCVKPPVIYGDVARPRPMTVDWITFAQSQTKKPMKGMLTGPVTIQKWSFVRNDQPLATTCQQIALAIRDEVADLEKAGIGIIQIDEAAFREGSPIRKSRQAEYYKWAVDSFRITAGVASDATQIHTHMCYSEFNGIMDQIIAMDADVITIECSRSQMVLLDAFAKNSYPFEIGPGVYDIHSARVPSVDEIVNLMRKAETMIPRERLWVNPDCGLKTRRWPETIASLKNMVEAAKQLRG